MVQQKLMSNALWNDLVQTVNFKNSSGTGVITLPPQFGSVVGYQLFGRAQAVFDMWREWSEGSWGAFDPQKCKTNNLYELPAGSVCQNEIQAYGAGGYGNLMLALNNPVDAGKVARFGGLDQNGEPIYDSTGALGVALTSVYPNAITSQLYSSLDTVQLPGFVGSCNLYVVINGVPSLLSYYNPGETLPYYKKYAVGVWNPQPGVSVPPIRCFCRRQFVPCVAETDFIFPGNINAIELGLQALKERRALSGLDESLWSKAFKELDDDLQQYRGAAEITLRLEGMALPTWEGNGGGNGDGWFGAGAGWQYGPI